MNFLSHTHKSLTYGALVKLFVLWLVFLSVLYAVQYWRFYQMDAEVLKSKTLMRQLSRQLSEQRIQTTSMNRVKANISGQKNLAAILQSRIDWSKYLHIIPRCLPAQVWLDDIDVRIGEDKQYQIIINGSAFLSRYVQEFRLNLDQSKLFSSTTVKTTSVKDSRSKVVEYMMLTYPQVRRK